MHTDTATHSLNKPETAPDHHRIAIGRMWTGVFALGPVAGLATVGVHRSRYRQHRRIGVVIVAVLVISNHIAVTFHLHMIPT